MEKRIEMETTGKQKDKILELNLDSCGRSTHVVGLTDEFKSLQKLSMINVGLASLEGFPTLPNLTKLELSDNRIVNGLEHLVKCQELVYINLSGNKIENVEDLKPLQKLKKLTKLDLYHNPTTNSETYPEGIFKLIPSLKVLDGFDSSGCQLSSDDDDDDEDDDDVEEDDDGQYDLSGSESGDFGAAEGEEVGDEDEDDDDDDEDDDDDDEDDDDDDEDDEVDDVDEDGEDNLPSEKNGKSEKTTNDIKNGVSNDTHKYGKRVAVNDEAKRISNDKVESSVKETVGNDKSPAKENEKKLDADELSAPADKKKKN